MEIQLERRQERLGSGERPIGWKVGFGAPAALERLQLAAPLVGFLTDKVLQPSGAQIATAGWIKPAVEPEVAVQLENDLSGAVERSAARAAIRALGPAFELADVSFPPDDVERILADNIYNRHVILGRADPARAGCQLAGLRARVDRDGQEIAAVTDLQAQTGDVIDIVCHVAWLLSRLGQKLSAGEVVIMGSIIPPLWVKTPEAIRYHLDPVDSIAVTLIEGT